MSFFSRKKHPSASQLAASNITVAQTRSQALAQLAVKEAPQQLNDVETAQNGPQSQQPRQQQNRGPVTNAVPHPSQTSPSQSQQQPQHQPQQRPAYPWSTHRLLLPPYVIPKAGEVLPTSSSPAPFPRYGHAIPATATASGQLYLFGGLVREIARNDLYLFSIRDPSATLVLTTGEIPSPRVGHASARVSSVLIIWGGDTKTDPMSDPTKKQDDGLYLLNLVSMEWTEVSMYGPSPSGRYGHAVTMVGTKFFVFGGQVDSNFFNDLWSFDLNTLRTQTQWEHCQPATTDRPAHRTGHICVTYGDRIIVFGGTDGLYHYNDTWAYDVNSCRWTELQCIGFIPSPREGHAAAVVDDVIYIFGGRDVNGKDLGDLAAFKLSNQRWYMIQNMGPAPSARSGHAMAAMGSRVVVLGGESFTPTGGDDHGIIHVLDTSSSIIALSQKPSHQILASRALVRTRLRQWDAAITDAEQSVAIQPSLVGYIAMSVALVGKGEREKGYRMCDMAFLYFHATHFSFLLIKAIIIFMSGEHIDAISRMDDLIATAPINSVCHAVQAYMYLLHGRSQMESNDCEGAIESFKLARSRAQHYGGRAPLVISLISGWRFDHLELTIREDLCGALYAAGHPKAVERFLEMVNDFDRGIYVSEPITEWISDFKRRCYRKLKQFGDAAMDAERHDEAITQYSVALSLNPDSQELLIKRSEARMAKGLWDDALTDVNEAIARDPPSPWGYEAKHAVLHSAKRYTDAVEAFETMLLMMAQSPDPNIREHRNQYISPSNIRAKIRKVVQRTIRRSPRVLINISTGRLQNRSEQASTFESSPVFNELLSSMTTRIDPGRIKREVREYFRYVMLSHKWEENEPLFQQVIHLAVYDLDKFPTHDKLQMFCKIVREAGFNWAWSDTCCIDKQDHFVLQEALVAMFKWYHNSAMVIVFLRGVRSPAKLGDLVGSIWNTRAWTFQEYVAGKVVHFYTEDWNLYLDLEIPNHKESPEIISEMEQAAGVSADQLMALRPGLNNIWEKLCLASARKTTLIEDAAYSLLGIFSVTSVLPNYGEGESAVGRLLAHILSSSGDASILAWTGHSSSINSCLPARITVYGRPPTSHLPLRIADAEIEKTVSTLRDSALDLGLAVRLYDRLNELSAPWFAGNRLKLPCIAFKLPPLSPYQSNSGRVFRVETPTFGTVEIKARWGPSRVKGLYLVHPWVDALLGREDSHVGASLEGDIGELFSPEGDGEDSTDDEDVEDDSSPPPERDLSLPPTPIDTAPLDGETRALQLVARLRQPFGALLFMLASMGGREVYKRMAADSLITVQMQENVSLDEVIENVRILDVL